MKIVTVSDKRTMKQFVRFPAELYRNDPFWAPPIWMDERKAYSKENNAILINSDYELFMTVDREGRVLGRCLVYIDRTFNSYYRSRTGFFGAFECTEQQAAADALLKHTEQWLRERGMETVRGPIHPIAECWGFLMDGFDSVPVLMSPYNPPYYHQFFGKLGYEKIKDLLAYEADSLKGYKIPERIERFSKTLLKKRPGLSMRRIDVRDLFRDAEIIWEITNIALKDNWGYVPVDRGVMEDMVKRLKMILDPDAVWFVEDNGKAVGFALGFPDINGLLKEIDGRLLPFGFLKLLPGIKKQRRYRLLSLAVLPEYHGLGLDVLLYKQLFDSLAPKNIVLEANYILEDNYNIRNALEKLELNLIKKYRIYEKTL